ncbi:MAG: hypothetical protein ACRC2R_16060 [Xenococcaceae cyanobacterium]
MKKTALLFLVLIVAIPISIAMFFVSWLFLAMDTEAFFHCLYSKKFNDKSSCVEISLESTPDKGYRRYYMQKSAE